MSFSTTQDDFDALTQRLLAIDDEMYRGWNEMDLVSAKTGMGGGNAVPAEVWDFVQHVSFLSGNKTHLYWAFGE
jgi:hypothetical protein